MFVTFVIRHAPITGICKPNSAIRMDHDIVRRIQGLSIPGIGEHGKAAVVFPSGHAPRIVLARELASFEIERIPIAVIGRSTKCAYVTVLFQPPHLSVAGYIAPD